MCTNIDISYLEAVNPGLKCAPPEFNYKEANSKVQDVLDSLQGLDCPDISLDAGIQDATFHAEISVGSYGAVRFSNFQCLVTITEPETFSPNLLSSIIEILERNGFTYVPFVVFGEPFEKRDRTNGDLFNQLFDYV